MTPYVTLILTAWASFATIGATWLALEVGVLRRRVEYLEALTNGDWPTVDRILGIGFED